MTPFAVRQTPAQIDKVLAMVKRRNDADVSGEAPIKLTGDKCAVVLANEVLHLRAEIDRLAATPPRTPSLDEIVEAIRAYGERSEAEHVDDGGEVRPDGVVS